MVLTRRRCVAGLMAAPLILAVPRAQAAAVVEVAPGDLSAALRAATPGSTLRLAPGDHGELALKGAGGKAGAPIRLTAADPGLPPRLTRLDLRDSAHLTFEGLHFAYRFAAGDKLNLRPFQIVGGIGIVFDTCRFEGDIAAGRGAADDGFPTAFGLALTECTASQIAGCEIHRFFRGLVVAQSEDIAVRGNDVHGIRMDGMNVAEVQRVLIEGNHIHDFDRSLASEDHPDMIQFWTNGTKAPSAGIVIRGNLLSSGRGAWTQSIFMRNDLVDRGLAGREMFYRDILIEENAILNAHAHGITVGETEGLVIRNNTLVHNPRSDGDIPNPSLWTPKINVAEASRTVTITRNVTAMITGWKNQPGWRVADNLLVQNRTSVEPGYYGGVFSGDPSEPSGFSYREGGPLDGAGIGAHLFQR